MYHSFCLMVKQNLLYTHAVFCAFASVALCVEMFCFRSNFIMGSAVFFYAHLFVNCVLFEI